MRLIWLLFPLLAGMNVQQADTTRNPLGDNPAAIADGRRLYDQACVSCHAPAGRGDRGPALDTGTFAHGSDDGDLFHTIREGVAGHADAAVQAPHRSAGLAARVVRPQLVASGDDGNSPGSCRSVERHRQRAVGRKRCSSAARPARAVIRSTAAAARRDPISRRPASRRLRRCARRS